MQAAVVQHQPAGVVLVQQRGQEAYLFGSHRVEVQQNNRAALELMVKELRSAQSVTASQAIRLLTEILADDPEQWAARYARGSTHLLFPRTAKHQEPAANDFLRLVELQRGRPPLPHYARTFVALGDAYVLDVQHKMARSWWEAGQKIFPEDPELAERLGIDLRALDSEILPRYGFDRPFDTDRDYLWVP